MVKTILSKSGLENFLLSYDAFVIDAYKTLEDENERLIEGAEDVLKLLKDYDKKVVIFTNYPKQQIDQIFCFRTITSGEVCLNILKNKKYKNYYLFGCREIKDFKRVDNLKEAEFVYLDLPALPAQDIHPSYRVHSKEFGDVCFCKEVSGFEQIIQAINEADLPVYSPKPEIKNYMKMENEKVVSFRRIIEKITCPVFEIGKPNIEAYENVLPGIDKKSRILCIGDTMKTDILGAENLKAAGYNAESLLVLSGETALNDLSKYDYLPDYIIDKI